MPQNAKATLAQRTPPPTDFIPDSGGSGNGGGGDFIPDAPTQGQSQSPSQPPQQGFWGALSNRINDVGKGIKDRWNRQPPQYDSSDPRSVQEGINEFDAPRREAQARDEGRQKAGRSLGYRVAAGLGENIGANPTASEQAADRGDSGAVWGNAVADIAPSAVAEGARAIGPLRSRIGASKSLESIPTRTLGDVIEAPSKAPAYAVRKAFPEPAAKVAERQPLQSTLEQRMKDIEGARQTELGDRGKQEMQFGTEQAEPVEQAIDADTKAREAVPISQSPGPYRGPVKPQPSEVSPVAQSPGPYRGPESVPPNVQSLSEGPTATQHQASKLSQRIATSEAAKADAAARQPMSISEGPTGARHAAARGAQADVARRNARQFVPTADSPSATQGVGVPGSAAQEAGYQPPVTRVPIRPEPPSPLTPEQVPGPDTAGKGNLLTPAARRGDPRAAQETMRRGRQVMYVPAEEYPGTRLEGTLAERMGQSQPPNLAKRTGDASFRTGIGPQSFEESGQMREGEVSPMAPAEKAELEQQVGRKLTDAEAYAERRRLAEWQSNQALRRGTVDVDPKQSAGLRDTQSKRKR